MKTLFIGGTGNISTSCTREALAQGLDLVHFNRGTSRGDSSRGDFPDVERIVGDIRDVDTAGRLLAGRSFDCVVDWIAFTPEEIRQDIELFGDIAGQFVFISSASVYHKPPRHYLITESTPAFNPFWTYSQNKIQCEQILWQSYVERGFPVTVVRPSHTYGDGWFPTTFGSRDFTVPQRILEGKPIVVHGDGQSLWTITHADDFARGFTGLLGNPAAIGETFHITGDESLTWDQIHETIACALGMTPEIVHVPSKAIADESPRFGPGLLGDKQYSLVFDNSKIKRFVPGYQATIPFFRGMERSVETIQRNPEMKKIEDDTDALIDRLVSRWAGPR